MKEIIRERKKIFKEDLIEIQERTTESLMILMIPLRKKQIQNLKENKGHNKDMMID